MSKTLNKIKNFFGLKQKKGQPTPQQPAQKQTKQANDTEKTAINKINELTAKVQTLKGSTNTQDLTDFIKQKDEYARLAGDSEEAEVAKQTLDRALDTLSHKMERFDEKQKKYAGIIAKNKGTPLETLIKRVNQKDRETVGVTESAQNLNPKTGIRKVFSKIGSKIKSKATEAFQDWSTGIDSATEAIGECMGISGSVSGLVGAGGDISDVEGVLQGINEKEVTGASVTGAVSAGVTTVVKAIKFIKDMVVEYRTDREASDRREVMRDHQERWKLARGYMRDLVELIGSFKDIFGPVSKMIPFFNSISSLCVNGATLMLDVVEMVNSSVHVDKMRKERNRIYKRIEAKRQKYTDAKDTAAADAYTIESKMFRGKNRDVDAKRRALMKTVFESENKRAMNAGKPKLERVSKERLRSRNDSEFRNIQYGLGERIKGTASTEKSHKRQMEALEMMQEYRTIDKAHKKMAKTLGHNIEDIIKGGVAIASDGLKLAGEIATASVAGAAGGVGAMGAGIGMEIGLSAYEKSRETGSFIYSSIRRLTGTKKNKETTREDMAISLINKMEEISKTSAVWENGGFASDAKLQDSKHHKEVVRQGRNVEHLHMVFRGGLDVTMSDLIQSDNKEELKNKIAESFGQG